MANVVDPSSSKPELPSASPLLLDVDEALAQLKISRGLLYRFMRVGQLQFVKLGKRTLFRPADLENFVDSQVKELRVTQEAT